MPLSFVRLFSVKSLFISATAAPPLATLAMPPTFPRFGSLDGGLQSPSPATLPQPPKFTGLPPERTRHFIYCCSVVAKAEYATMRDRVTFTSLFLRGPALDWFMALLARNADAYLPVENARRAYGEGKLDVDRADTFGLTTLPFVIPELAAYSAFLDALLAAFPDRR